MRQMHWSDIVPLGTFNTWACEPNQTLDQTKTFLRERFGVDVDKLPEKSTLADVYDQMFPDLSSLKPLAEMATKAIAEMDAMREEDAKFSEGDEWPRDAGESK